MLKPLCLFALVMSAALVTAQAPSATDPDINKKIRAEENDHSQIMHTMHFLADIYGPRLTGSPNHKAAADWAIKQMKDWGLENAHLEPWDFGHPGWVNERASGYIVAPIKDQLTFKVLAWTPGTKGTVTAQVFQMVPPEKPKKEDLTAYLDSIKDKVKGKIVLVGKAEVVPVVIDVPARRLDDKLAAERFDPKNPNAGQFGPRRDGQRPPEDPPGTLTGVQINQQIDEFLLASGALLRANDARMGNGRIRAFQNRTYDIAKVVPTVVLRNEDYGRIARILADGSTVELEFNIQNKIYPEGKTSYNTIAEIPGTDRKDEVVMLGGHLDSWHSATGATDNAIGCAIMMEATRILKSLGVKPRRTIRVACGAGKKKACWDRRRTSKSILAALKNQSLNSISSWLISTLIQARDAFAALVFLGRRRMPTFFVKCSCRSADLGIAGAISNKNRRAGGTDSSSFAQAGLPGIGLGQDPIEYFTDTWHTNIDTYERIIEDDVKKDAIVVAASVYQLAMRDDMLPRFAAADMPPKPEPPGAAQPVQAAVPAQPAAGSGGAEKDGAAKAPKK